MLKVLLVHNYYQQAGGEDQVVADEAGLLEQNGCTVIRYHRHNDEVAQMGRVQAAAATLWSRRSYRVTADALGRWAYHCHLLYHMEAGMMREVRVEERTS